MPSSPVAALQIPVQITHLAATGESCGTNTDCETITLNTGTLQRFEFLPSFRLQPTGTPGTYLIQTSSSQSLPLTLTTSPAVTLTSPPSPEQIIVHTLSALVSPSIDADIDEETTLIVSADHSFIQSDDIDNDSVLPLSTLTDPILHPQGDCSDIISSSLESPDPDD